MPPTAKHTFPALMTELLDQLVAEGVITHPRVEILQKRLHAEWTPLGKVLRQRGHLTMRQLVNLLQIQDGNPSTPLGALAVREGFCTQHDLEEALRIQSSSAPHVFELLAQDGSCDQARLFAFVVRYVRLLENQASQRAHEPRS
jgi:hypothetical protein